MRDFLLVAALALLAFSATVAGSFHFDDYSLFQSPGVVAPNGWGDVFRLEQTRPLTYLTFWLNYQAGGRNPLGYHLVNLALHIAAALLIRRVAARVVPATVALVAAALFAVHPLCTEPVAYVFARGTLLMTVLSLLAVDAWLRERPWTAAALFAVAVLAKEECVALPFVLVLLHYAHKRSHPDFRPIAAMLAFALAAGVRVLYALAVTPGAWAGAKAGISPAVYLGIQGPVILRYLRQFVLPWGFSVDPQIGPFPLWAELSAWAALIAAVVFAARSSGPGKPGLWFIAAIVLLLPSSSVLPASDLAADRRMYLPLTVLSIAAALVLTHLDRRVVAAIVVALCAISFRYSLVWRTEESLWAEAVARAPGKIRPRIHLARVIPPDRAMPLLNETALLAPADPAIPSEQGRIYLSAGMPVQALSAFGRALALEPGDPEALQNRGVALLALGQTEAARQDFVRALEKQPCLFEAQLNLRRTGVRQAPAHCRFTPEQQAQLEAGR